MPPVAFPAEIKLDGVSYRARRLDGSRSYSSTYVPQMAGQGASVQLDPLNDADWGDGRGWAQNADTSEGMLLPGPLVTSVNLPVQPGADLEQFAEQDGHIYLVGGRYAYRIDGGSAAPIQSADFGASFGAVSVVPFKTSLYVGGRATGNLWKLPTGGAWSNAMGGGAVQRGKLATVFWRVAGLSSLTLVGEQGSTGVSYVAADPMLATNWTPNPTPIEIARTIRSVVAYWDHVYFATTHGLLDLDTDGKAPNLTPEVELMPMDTNGRAVLPAGGWVYYNAGYTLQRMRAVGQEYASVQECGWSAQLPPQCPMSGYASAIVKAGRWLWCSVYDGTNSWVCKARESVPGDRYGPLVWFVAPIYLPGLKVTSMHVSGLVAQNPRLWMGVTDGTTRSLRWAPLPLDSAYRDLRQARLYRFALAAQFDEPEADHGDDAMPKILRELVGEGENLGTGTSDTLSVATDGAASFSQIGIYRQNPRAVVKPPATILASRYILRHTLSGLTTQPPVLRKQSRRVIPRPDLLEVRTYQVVAGPAVRLGDGGLEGRSVKATRRRFARLQRLGPVSLRDEDNANLTVLVAAGAGLTELEAQLGQSGDRRVLVADLQIAVLVGQGGSTFRLNDGTRWDDPAKVLA